ncbi:hypothetical protein PFZ55_16005 [Streptomyces sp. MS2A]|nr:hypothetical protein [Streptomyces sp. MS2A]
MAEASHRATGACPGSLPDDGRAEGTQERAAHQHPDRDRDGTSTRPTRLNAGLVVDRWPLDRGRFDQIDVLEVLKNVAEGGEGLVVECVACLLQGGVLHGEPLIELLLLALEQTSAPPSVRFRKPAHADWVNGHVLPLVIGSEILLPVETVLLRYDVDGSIRPQWTIPVRS